MSIQMQIESTEYVYCGIQGTVPNSAKVAFLTAGVRPLGGDWIVATLITSPADPLWADASASGATGDYFVTLLIGSYVGNITPHTLAAGDYQEWIQLTGDTEQPVRIAPVTLEVVAA